jgi:hypothetical protein
VGNGACGRFTPYANSPLDHTSAWVNDWAYANEAHEIVADQLRQWDVADDFGITMRAPSCDVPD